ncbi:MAG: hypothetical protein MUC88_14025 [Planctomycetes bacterium]|nr:hypothetical protein [Planctomycetota bacterium]
MFVVRQHGWKATTLVAGKTGGFLLDLSFSGDAISGGDLVSVLRNKSGTVRGTPSGQISIVPRTGNVAAARPGRDSGRPVPTWTPTLRTISYGFGKMLAR